jgi:hypothetical protein
LGTVSYNEVMYKYTHPKPIAIKLINEEGWELRNIASEHLKQNVNTTGAERGNIKEQGVGVLAEMVVRKYLGMPIIKPEDQSIAYDLILPSGVKVDVKCRGGLLPFKENYEGPDALPRESKHNLFARQIFDENLDTDIFLLTHMEMPKSRQKSGPPGTRREKKWVFYVCGWVSKYRVKRDGVYLPRGAMTEQGKKWFDYRGQEIEFYNKNINGLEQISDLLKIDRHDVELDMQKVSELNMTAADAIRIATDLVGKGVLEKNHLENLKDFVGAKVEVAPFLHPNQYYHLIRWLTKKGIVENGALSKLQRIFEETRYTSI